MFSPYHYLYFTINLNWATASSPSGSQVCMYPIRHSITVSSSRDERLSLTCYRRRRTSPIQGFSEDRYMSPFGSCCFREHLAFGYSSAPPVFVLNFISSLAKSCFRLDRLPLSLPCDDYDCDSLVRQQSALFSAPSPWGLLAVTTPMCACVDVCRGSSVSVFTCDSFVHQFFVHADCCLTHICFCVEILHSVLMHLQVLFHFCGLPAFVE